MIVTISGTAGSGKSAVGRELARRLKLKHYSIGGFMREMAEEKEISLLELSKQAETDRGIDEELDRRQIDLGKKEENFVIDSRLGFHFIPNSIKIFLDADINIRAKRIVQDTIRNEHNVNHGQAAKNIKTREASEKKRYKEYYHLNYLDKKPYDLVIDTTELTIEQVVEKIVEFVKGKE